MADEKAQTFVTVLTSSAQHGCSAYRCVTASHHSTLDVLASHPLHVLDSVPVIPCNIPDNDVLVRPSKAGKARGSRSCFRELNQITKAYVEEPFHQDSMDATMAMGRRLLVSTVGCVAAEGVRAPGPG